MHNVIHFTVFLSLPYVLFDWMNVTPWSTPMTGAEVVTDFGMVCLLYADPEQIFLKCWNREKTVGQQKRSMRKLVNNCGNLTLLIDGGCSEIKPK